MLQEYAAAGGALAAVTLVYYLFLSGAPEVHVEACDTAPPGPVALFLRALWVTVWGRASKAPPVEPPPQPSVVDDVAASISTSASSFSDYAAGAVSSVLAAVWWVLWCMWSVLYAIADFLTPDLTFTELLVYPLLVLVPVAGFFLLMQRVSQPAGAKSSPKASPRASPKASPRSDSGSVPAEWKLPPASPKVVKVRSTESSAVVETITKVNETATVASTSRLSVEPHQTAGSRTSTPTSDRASLNGGRRTTSLGDSMTEQHRAVLERLDQLISGDPDDETLQLLSALRDLILEVVDEVEFGRAESISLQQRNSIMTDEALRLSTKLSEVECDKAELEVALKACEARRQAEHEAASRDGGERAELLQQLADMRRSQVDLEAQLHTSDDALVKVRAASTEYRTSATAELQDLRDECEELTAQLRAAQSEVAKKDEENEALRGEVSEGVTVETTRMEASLARATEELRVARDEATSVTDEATTRTAIHTRERADLEEQVHGLRTELSQERSRFEREIQHLTDALEAVTSSEKTVTGTLEEQVHSLELQLATVTTEHHKQVSVSGILTEEKQQTQRRLAEAELNEERVRREMLTLREDHAKSMTSVDELRETNTHLTESKEFLTRRLQILEKNAKVSEETRALEVRTHETDVSRIKEQYEEQTDQHMKQLKSAEEGLVHLRAEKESLQSELRVSRERTLELADVLENSANLERNLEQTSAMLQAAEEREAALEMRLEQTEKRLDAERGREEDIGHRCDELSRDVQRLQTQLRDEQDQHRTLQQQLRTDASALESELDRVVRVAEEEKRRADSAQADDQTVRILSIQLEERQARVEAAEKQSEIAEQRYLHLESRVVDYVGHPHDGEDLYDLLRRVVDEQKRLKQELWGRDMELEKRAADVGKLSGYKGELESALRNTAHQLELEKNRSRGVNQELKKLTQRLSILQQNSPRSSSRDRASRAASIVRESPGTSPSAAPSEVSSVKRSLDLDTPHKSATNGNK